MPRIRTIKPDFCTSEQVAECSPNARLLFVCMWCFCDDAGRHVASVRRLKMECFPGDPFTTEDMQGMVDELIGAGLLVEYEFEGDLIWEVTGWKHQKIDRPNVKYGPKTPKKEAIPINEADGVRITKSAKCRQVLDEYSSSDRRAFVDRSPPEGKGKEGRGEERNGEDYCGVPDESATPPQPVEPEEPSDFDFVLSSGERWNLPKSKISEYSRTFPTIDLDSEMKLAAQWLRDNPQRRKTASGMYRFLTNWLSKTQNTRGGRRAAVATSVWEDSF